MRMSLRCVPLWMVLVLAATPAGGQTVQCGHPLVELEAGERADHEFACASAQRAVDFLSRFGLQPKRTIRIAMVDHNLESAGHAVFGSYNSQSDRIEVMTLDTILASATLATMYEEPFDRDHYAGVIAHEVAHAIMQHNARVPRLSNAAQEYLAHATQLAVLPEARRAGIIRSADVGAWETDDVISDIYMALALNRFAVKCYLHLTGIAHPEEFVQLLLGSNWRYVVVR